MKVFQRLAHAFKAEGVDATFGMMGDGNMFWLHEMHKLGIKVHEVRHEGAGLGMADGYARTSRRVGVATATCGPGTSQLATAFVTAARQLERWGFPLIDCQMRTSHLARFGAVDVPRATFLDAIRPLVAQPDLLGPWTCALTPSEVAPTAEP